MRLIWVIGLIALNCLSWWALIYYNIKIIFIITFIIFIMSLMVIAFIFNRVNKNTLRVLYLLYWYFFGVIY